MSPWDAVKLRNAWSVWETAAAEALPGDRMLHTRRSSALVTNRLARFTLRPLAMDGGTTSAGLADGTVDGCWNAGTEESGASQGTFGGRGID